MDHTSFDEDASEQLAQWLARTALRDQVAFKSLYDATVRCLRGVVSRLLRDPAWTEEVLQEAYVAVWNSAQSYAIGKARPMTWLITVARNKALDALRSRSSEHAHTVPLQLEGSDGDVSQADARDDSAGPLERLTQRMDEVRLKSCLQSLDATQRQAISLAYWFGLTHAELAQHMNAPLGTVKAWVRRGLDRLKGCVSV